MSSAVPEESEVFLRCQNVDFLKDVWNRPIICTCPRRDDRFFDCLFSYPTHHSVVLSFSVPGFGVISSMTVEEGFRNVDRKFFVPKVGHLIQH